MSERLFRLVALATAGVSITTAVVALIHAFMGEGSWLWVALFAACYFASGYIGLSRKPQRYYD